MHIPSRTQSLPPGPIDALNARAAQLRLAGARVISLGQAVPSFAPLPGALAAARAALDEPATHLYSPDAGLLALREAWAAHLGRWGLSVDPAREIIFTPGANQAFTLAMLTLLEHGDRVLLPAPYYLNHDGAVRMTGGVPVEIPLDPAAGFAPRLADVAPYLDGDARALVLVTPNNPTGAVYDPAELVAIGRACAARGIAVITDETYQYFTYPPARHFSLASVPDLRPHVITLGSFSKTFGMTGWRLGYLAGPPDVVAAALKVQDALVICAPTITQKAVLGALPELDAAMPARLAVLAERRDVLAHWLARMPRLDWQPTHGALFAFVRVRGCADSAALAREILERAHVVVVPGSAFGRHGEGCLRLAYGAVEMAELEKACERLEEVLNFEF
jgi:aspartate/methionine/tyrosine aminotransferase